MKKLILIVAALSISFAGFAQKKYVTSANVALKRGDLDEAKDDIDKAMANPETMDKPDAIWTKVQVYFALMQSDKYKASNPYKEAAQALLKLAEMKPDYEKASVDQVLLVMIGTYYNLGVQAYNSTNDSNKYTTAAYFMGDVVKIRNLNGGKRFEKFEKIKNIDTIAAKANMIYANCLFYSNQYDDAIAKLVEVKNNPITKTPAVYGNLIEAYARTKKTAEEEATIQEARAAFPTNEAIRNAELNYYLTSGKQGDLLKKLEEDVAKEPNSPDLQISLATTYYNLANPKSGAQPANRAELLAKAEGAYQSAVKLDPDNADYNYNFGGLYYNQAKEVNDQMNAITGSSAADTKKYDDLKVKRDGYFNKALPYMEKAYNTLDAKAGSLSDSDKTLYSRTIQALTQIYLIQSKMDKVDALKKKMSTAK